MSTWDLYIYFTHWKVWGPLLLPHLTAFQFCHKEHETVMDEQQSSAKRHGAPVHGARQELLSETFQRALLKFSQD